MLEKNIYQLGETIRVKIDCDNTKSGSDVKSFKIKLKRKVDLWAQAGEQKFKIHESDYVASLKGSGCKKGKKFECTLELEIPKNHTPTYVPKDLSDFDLKML